MCIKRCVDFSRTGVASLTISQRAREESASEGAKSIARIENMALTGLARLRSGRLRKNRSARTRSSFVVALVSATCKVSPCRNGNLTLAQLCTIFVRARALLLQPNRFSRYVRVSNIATSKTLAARRGESAAAVCVCTR